MTQTNVLKFSIALSAAATAHLSVLAYAVPHAPPALVAGNSFGVQFGTMASSVTTLQPDALPSGETEPAPAQSEQQTATLSPPSSQSPNEPARVEKVYPDEPTPETSVTDSDPLLPEEEIDEPIVVDRKLEPAAQADPAMTGSSAVSAETPSNPSKHKPVGSNPHPRAKASARASSAPAKEPSSESATSAKSAAAGNSEYSNYSGKVMKHLSQLRRPRASGPGSAHIRFTVSPRGTIKHIEVSQSSGSSRFDRQALIFVKKASPFPAPPTGISHSFAVEIEGS
jgi:periplasmic protein TonB